MSEPRNLQDILAQAERAAIGGDLASADELLRDAALLQEHELGPLHPDLANTLNNRAIIAEKAGRLDDAETFYRRAVAIASSSLAQDDPIVVDSRQNLEDFCNAHGRPIERPTTVSVHVAEEAPEPQSIAPPPPAPAPAPAPAPTQSSPPSPPPASLPSPPVTQRAPRAPAALAIGALALFAVALLIVRPWSSPRQESTPAPAAEPAKSSEREPARPAPDASSPAARTPTPTPPPAPNVDRSPSASAISLVTVQLCWSFSTRDWRCQPAGDPMPPGTVVLYTRVRSPRDGVIVHRWYRGDSLRKSAQLRIGANATDGYRTYSRQSVDRGDWRVEVRSAAGEVLHEQRLTVR